MREPFYHSTVKRLVTVFGSVFNNITYEDDFGNVKKVPLFYGPRDKMLVDRLEAKDMHRLGMESPYPRMGFELAGMNYAPERMTNPLHRIHGEDKSRSQFNRVPYDFTFNLYLAAKQFEPSLRIIEQIVPIFGPTFNVTVDEMSDFNTSTDISLTLDSVAHDIDYQGSMDDNRTIMWTLSFTMKAYLYNKTDILQTIKETITTMTPDVMDAVFEQFTARVEPRRAGRNDPHIIVEE